MRFTDLEPFDVITVAGVAHEVQFLSDSKRIAFCRVLDAEGNYTPSDSEYERSGFKTAVITDLRYNEEMLKDFNDERHV